MFIRLAHDILALESILSFFYGAIARTKFPSNMVLALSFIPLA